jgi:hypothetical protein
VIYAERARDPRLPIRRRTAAPSPASAAVLALQRSAGNQATVRALAREPAPPAEAPAQPAESQIDHEGNVVDTTGKPHLTALPAGVTWHKGEPEALPPNPLATYAALREQCNAVYDEQKAYAAALKGDMKYWFARVYSHVTEEELKQIDLGTYDCPLMKMQEVLAFHATYKQNIENWRAGAKSLVEPNWVAAFSAAEALNGGSYVQSKSVEIVHALLPSFQAHIRFDLPRAIASVYERNYAGIPGLSPSLFKPDYDEP